MAAPETLVFCTTKMSQAGHMVGVPVRQDDEIEIGEINALEWASLQPDMRRAYD